MTPDTMSHGGDASHSHACGAGIARSGRIRTRQLPRLPTPMTAVVVVGHGVGVGEGHDAHHDTLRRGNQALAILEIMSGPADQVPSDVPVLLLTGPTGAGKTTIAMESARLLNAAEVPHAMVDLAVIAECSPRPPDDPWNERLLHRNLACMWQNFRQAGADRLILCRVLEDRSLLRYVAEAVPGAQITVIRLTAKLSELHARIYSREAGRDPQWYLDVATSLAVKLDESRVEDHIVSNQDRSAADAAEDALRLAGWLTSTQ